MKRKYRNAFTAVIALFFAVLFAFNSAMAAPYNGDAVKFTQPDGSIVTALLYGDELHIDAESHDGYTLIRDADGWICYAQLSADGSEYVTTGVRYTETGRAPAFQKKKQRVSVKSVIEKRRQKREALGGGDNARRVSLNKLNVGAMADGIQPAPVADDTTYGVMLVIQYPEWHKKTSLTKDQIDWSVNDPDNVNSMFSWYKDVSNGKVLYKNIFTAVVTVDKSYDYYDDDSDYKRIPELITNALYHLQDTISKDLELAAEFSKITTYMRRSGVNVRKTALALNILQAHTPLTWAKGTWSHRGWYNGGPLGTPNASTRNVNQAVNGIYFYDYQLSDLDYTSYTGIPMTTILHENGHLLMGWPDLYPYVSGERDFVAKYCIMSSGVVMPNPYFRDLAGWIDVIDITDLNATLTHTANSHTVYKYVRNNQESYYIEARRREGRSSSLPSDGLLIWHIHTAGDNNDYAAAGSTASQRIPLVALMQADHGADSPGRNTPYTAVRNARFNKDSSPSARYHQYVANNARATNVWSGDYSDINITEISAAPTAANNSMTFKIGVGGDDDIDTVASSINHAAVVAPLKFDIKVMAAGNVNVWVEKTGVVSVMVYDIRGRVAATLTNGVKSPGVYNMKISANRGASMSSGLYIVKMKSGSFSKSVKFYYKRH